MMLRWRCWQLASGSAAAMRKRLIRSNLGICADLEVVWRSYEASFSNGPREEAQQHIAIAFGDCGAPWVGRSGDRLSFDARAT